MPYKCLAFLKEDNAYRSTVISATLYFSVILTLTSSNHLSIKAELAVRVTEGRQLEFTLGEPVSLWQPHAALLCELPVCVAGKHCRASHGWPSQPLSPGAV